MAMAMAPLVTVMLSAMTDTAALHCANDIGRDVQRPAAHMTFAPDKVVGAKVKSGAEHHPSVSLCLTGGRQKKRCGDPHRQRAPLYTIHTQLPDLQFSILNNKF
jgi:hypothetical protein